MTEHNDLPYLQHVLDAIQDIEESVKEMSKEQFLTDKDVKDANIRRLEIIGEAVKNMSKKLREEHKEIEWNKIAGTRDKIIHKYFGVNLDIVWETIKTDLPDLKVKVEKIVKTL